MSQLKGMKFTKKRILIVAVLITLLILSIPFYIKYKSRHKIFARIENVPKTEFVIVLGAAITLDNQPSSYLKYRLDDAIDLYKAGKIKKILVSGDNGNDAHDEISVMNNYLVQNGIPQNVIYGDYAGFDTYSSMDRAKKIFRINKAIIVSQGFHLPRSLYIAHQKGIEATGYASNQSFGKNANSFREHFASIKAYFDCLINRKSKFYGDQVNTDSGSNIVIDQLETLEKTKINMWNQLN